MEMHTSDVRNAFQYHHTRAFHGAKRGYRVLCWFCSKKSLTKKSKDSVMQRSVVIVSSLLAQLISGYKGEQVNI